MAGWTGVRFPSSPPVFAVLRPAGLSSLCFARQALFVANYKKQKTIFNKATRRPSGVAKFNLAKTEKYDVCLRFNQYKRFKTDIYWMYRQS